jgi:hypothetical protein
LKQGLNALRVLLGMAPEPLDNLLGRSTRIPVPPRDVVVGIPADLVRRRPDIRAVELAAAAQSAQVGIAEADLYPAFSLFGTFGTVASNINGNKLSQLFQGKGITFAFGPSFQWNILNYGQITNTVRVQDAKLQGLLVDYQNAVLKAQQQVEDGLASFLQGREQVEFLRKSVAAADAALGLAIIQWNLGTRDFTTVLTAEQNLYTAQNNLAMAEGGVSTGLASVYRALGGGWQIRAENEFVPAITAEEMRRRTTGVSRCRRRRTQPPAPGLPNLPMSVPALGCRSGEVVAEMPSAISSVAPVRLALVLATSPVCRRVWHGGVLFEAIRFGCRGGAKIPPRRPLPSTQAQVAAALPRSVIRPKMQASAALSIAGNVASVNAVNDRPRRGLSRADPLRGRPTRQKGRPSLHNSAGPVQRPAAAGPGAGARGAGLAGLRQDRGRSLFGAAQEGRSNPGRSG